MTSAKDVEPRRTRRSAQKKSYVYSSGSSGEEDAEILESVARGRKQGKELDAGTVSAKKKGVKGRGRNLGKLQALMDMPLDILSEITGSLRPIDILHMSRVSHHFRSLFNPYTNKQTWIAARRNTPGLPNCPEDLNEGQYASLIFEHHCQGCDAKRANMDDYALYVRLCKRCHTSRVKKGTVILRELGRKPKEVQSEIWFLAPRSYPYRNFVPLHAEPSIHNKYLKDDFERAFRHYSKLTPKAAGEYLAERREIVQKRHAFADSIAEWKKSVQEDNHEIESQRAKDIKDRMRREHGWTEEMFDLVDDTEKCHRLLYQPRPLTQRIFTTVKKELEALLVEQRVEERSDEFRNLVHGVIGPSLSHSDFPHLPSTHVIVKLPAAVDLLKENGAETPITAERIHGIAEVLLAQIQPLSISVRRTLLGDLDRCESVENWYLRSPISDEVVNARQANGDLHRAKFVFTCRPSYYELGSGCGAVVNLDEYPAHSRSVDHRTRLDVDKTLTESAMALLRKLGLPQSASVDDTKQFDKRLKCSCRHPKLKHKGIGFYEMIRHFHEENTADATVSMFMRWPWVDSSTTTHTFLENLHQPNRFDAMIEVLPEPLDDSTSAPESTAQSTSESEDTSTDADSQDLRLCKVCSEITDGRADTQLTSAEEIEYHLRTRHGIEGENLEEHIF